MICLIGPGGAGKSTTGAVLAHRLAVPFHDLDRQFAEQAGDIDWFIASHGYDAYAHQNVEVYCSIVAGGHDGVLALSSGFMTYTLAIHPTYEVVRHGIESSPTTVVLLPSLDFEACVAETVRRQLTRPLCKRAASREEAIIRKRFPIYIAMPVRKTETMRPTAEVVAEIMAQLHLSLGVVAAP